MNSPSSLAHEVQPSSWEIISRQVFRSRWTFATLQVLDLLTTLAAFRAGAFEVNPLVARLTIHFGHFGGVLASKVIAILIAFRVRRLLWVINVFYTGVVFWNVVLLILLWLKGH